MITRERAERLADEIVGQRDEWELVEFDAGWLIVEASAKDPAWRGAATRVIERSGRVMEFSSSVPPDRILNEYAEVAGEAYIKREALFPKGRHHGFDAENASGRTQDRKCWRP